MSDDNDFIPPKPANELETIRQLTLQNARPAPQPAHLTPAAAAVPRPSMPPPTPKESEIFGVGCAVGAVGVLTLLGIYRMGKQLFGSAEK